MKIEPLTWVPTIKTEGMRCSICHVILCYSGIAITDINHAFGHNGGPRETHFLIDT